jgi:hypothetical protein
MKTALCAGLLLLILSSCDKTSTESNGLYGVYKGYFSRSGMDTSLVNLDFTGDNYTGSSNQDRYPAICKGSFDIEDNRISFHDSCVWTADFDWSFILDGDYNISFNEEGTVRIWRTNAAGTDEYLLKKPFR